MADITKIDANQASEQENSWLIDFLDQQKSQGISHWPADSAFQFTDKNKHFHQFSFTMPVYARPKHKNPNQFVYEMVDTQDCLGQGTYGHVYSIKASIGRNHEQQYRARNKNRVGKLTTSQKESLNEFQRAAGIDYLHAKAPLNGLMVMKRLKGTSLDKYLQNNSLSREQAWALTHALALAVARLAKQGIEHLDAHHGNLMVQEKMVDGKPTYKIKAVDFAYSTSSETYNENTPCDDFFTFFQYVFPQLWKNQPNIPVFIDILKNNTLPIKQILTGFNLYAVSPMPAAQEMLDHYYLYLSELNKQFPKAVRLLKNKMIEAVKQSTTDNIEPMREAIFESQAYIKQHCASAPAFPLICLDSDPAKQQAFNKIMRCHEKLIKHAAQLGNPSFDKMCNELKHKTLSACYADIETPGAKEKRAAELIRCNNTWQHQLTSHHKDIKHVEGKRIVAEALIALSCLIILYPVALLINYGLTKRVGLLCHSAAEAIPAKAEQRFKVLCN